MMEHIIQWDKDLFFLINGWHSATWDPVMMLISSKWIWIPLYLFLISSTIYFYKKKSWILILAVLLSVGASDYLASGFLKPTIKRYRPSRNVEINEQVHMVNNYRGGKYGFASSHAANSFAIGVFFLLLFRKRTPWAWTLILWAVIVSYSRIYLGVHYPGDILAGALIGTSFAASFLYFTKRIDPSFMV